MPRRRTTPCSSARSGASGARRRRSSPAPTRSHYERAGITRDTVSPVAALTIEKDENGDPTGVFIEEGMQPTAELIWFRQATEFTRADRARALPLSAQAYHAFGTTSVFEEHGIANEVIRAYKDAYRDGTLTMRSALVFSPNWKAIGDAPLGPFMEAWAGWIGEPGLGDDWLKVTGLHVNIGRSPAEDVRATASPYTGWAGFNYDTGLTRERVKDDPPRMREERHPSGVEHQRLARPHRSPRGGRPRGAAEGPALGDRAHQRALAPRHRTDRAHGPRRHATHQLEPLQRRPHLAGKASAGATGVEHAAARSPRRRRQRRPRHRQRAGVAVLADLGDGGTS